MKINNGVDVRFSFNSYGVLSREFVDIVEKTLFHLPCTPIIGMRIDLIDFKDQMGLNEKYFNKFGDEDTYFEFGDSIYIYPDHLLIILFES